MFRITSLIVLGFANCLSAGEPATTDPVEKALLSKDFYDSGFGANLTATEVGRIETLAREHDSATVRVRAQHILVELKHNGRVKAQQRDVMLAGLRYLEETDSASVDKLLSFRFTHYCVSSQGANNPVFLIESLPGPMANGGIARHPNGGLNMTYDPKTRTITSVEAWGDCVAPAGKK